MLFFTIFSFFYGWLGVEEKTEKTRAEKQKHKKTFEKHRDFRLFLPREHMHSGCG